jgi:hypothetical protein
MNNDPMTNESENRINIESNIRIASRILSGPSLIGPWQCYGGDSGDRSLPLSCYLSQLLSVGERDIAVTGTLAFDSASGKVKAKTIVAVTNSLKSTNIDQKDTKSEWEFKDLDANEDRK